MKADGLLINNVCRYMQSWDCTIQGRVEKIGFNEVERARRELLASSHSVRFDASRTRTSQIHMQFTHIDIDDIKLVRIL